MNITELIEKHAKVTDADLEWSWEVRLKEFAIELLEMVKNGGDYADDAIDKALEELRK
jgi:hypothetical protein